MGISLEIDWIRKNVRCCACGRPLSETRYINYVCLDRLATWKNPTWKNILLEDMSPEPRALAVLCDKCIEENRLPEYAVEWDVESNLISYHRVEELTPLPSLEEVRKKKLDEITRILEGLAVMQGGLEALISEIALQEEVNLPLVQHEGDLILSVKGVLLDTLGKVNGKIEDYRTKMALLEEMA
jgi:hypothetical protein